MYRRNPSNSPWLAYIVSVFPFIVFISLWYALYSILQTGQYFNFYTLLFLGFLVILICCGIFYFADVLIPKFLIFSIIGAFIVGLVITSIAVYNYLSSYSFTMQNISRKIWIILGFVVGLAGIMAVCMIYFPNWLRSIYNGSMGETMKMWMEYVRDDLRMTPTFFYVLLSVIFTLLFGYIILAYFFSKNTPIIAHLNFNGMRVLKEGKMMLNHEELLATSNDLKVIDPEFAANPFLKIYSISMWLYVNPKDEQLGTVARDPHQPSLQWMNPTTSPYQSIRETNIFFYGTKQLNEKNQWEMIYPKPSVTYTYDYGTKKNMFLVYAFGDEPYKLYLTPQKWHQLVFVFHDNHMDLFTDSELVYSSPMTGAGRMFTENDTIVVGDTKQSIYGALADVVYYDHTLSKENVLNMWNLQKYPIDTNNT